MKPSTELEILVARIQQQLAPKAEVLHNVKMEGRSSKRTRQVDVLVREKIGQYQIQIVIECKDYKTPEPGDHMGALRTLNKFNVIPLELSPTTPSSGDDGCGVETSAVMISAKVEISNGGV